jgi:TRAP-type mannitol/chloroaromatic compound transport system permease small subunit
LKLTPAPITHPVVAPDRPEAESRALISSVEKEVWLMKSIPRFLDKLVVKQAEASSMLMILLVVIMTIEVFRRYFLGAPSVWALEFTTFLYGAHFILGYGYTEQFHGHVNVDIFSSKLPQKLRTVLYIVTTAVISLPISLLLCIWAFDNAWISSVSLERSPSAWNPPIWPVKILMALGFTILVLQIISNILKKIDELVHPKAENEVSR